jgi:hypothetical protein
LQQFSNDYYTRKNRRKKVTAKDLGTTLTPAVDFTVKETVDACNEAEKAGA